MIFKSLILAAAALVSFTAADTSLYEISADEPRLSQAISNELLYLHRKLVETESITGDEEDIGTWLGSYLQSKGYNVERQEVSQGRYNILAYPEKRDTTILVTSHIDTVPPYWPYYYNKTSNIIGGRGSVDAKASVAAQITAVLGLNKKLHGDVSLLYVVGEETGGDGMKNFSAASNRPSYDIVIFGEPTEGKLVCGHKGMLGFSLKVTGKAAHSGYPWLGVSANDVIVEALGELLWLRQHLPWSAKYGNTTMNFGKITGGVAANVVAETAEARIAVRLAAATPLIVQGMIINALKAVKSKAEELGGGLEIEWAGEGYPPVNIDCDVKGFDTLTVNYGTDVPLLEGNHKRYLYGPGSIFVAHSDHEALQRQDLERAVFAYIDLITKASQMHNQGEGLHVVEEQLEM